MTQQHANSNSNTALDAHTAEQHLRDYLRGYARNDVAKLHALLRYPGWQRAAFDEQQRRARSLIEKFDDALLEAIAMQAVRVETVAEQLADELKADEREAAKA